MLPDEVAGAVGAFFRATAAGGRREGAAHGDLAPWNLLETPDGWVLVDWEHSRVTAPPFFDVFHYVVQAHALLERPTRHEVIAGIATGEGWVGRAIGAYASQAGIAADRAIGHLPAYLEASIAMLDADAPDGHKGIAVRRALLREVERLR
jgi:aminoglycoside phosphotransferase (APT) family kinase protein